MLFKLISFIIAGIVTISPSILFSQQFTSPAEIAKSRLPKKVYRQFNWNEVFPIKNDSLLIGWQVNKKDTSYSADSTFQFLILENENGQPKSYYQNTIQYSFHPTEERILPKKVISENLLTKENTMTNLWGSLGEPDTTIKGTDNVCTPACDTISRVLLIPHPEDTVPNMKRRYISMINSFYLGIRTNPKSHSIGSLFTHIKKVRPLTNTPSYIYIHPNSSRFSSIKQLEVFDITRFKDIYVWNFYFWWTGSEYTEETKRP
jgi:hypothetical protein